MAKQLPTTTTTLPVQAPNAASPVSNNPILNAAGGAGAGAGTPQQQASSTDTTRFGLTQAELNTPVTVDLGAPPAGPFGVIYQQPNFDPFGIGMPIQGVSAGDVTVQDLLDYIQSLSPDQLSQVQADLANSGYYGAMNSLAQEPMWGSLGTADFTALAKFAKDAIGAVQSGGTITSMLSMRSQQFATQQKQMSSLTPVKDLGKNYTITNLDPNEALNMVDKSSMSVLGKQLPANQRQQMGQWLNQLYTSRQQSADQGDIAQNAMNAEATAQASDFVDPVTGRALDYNGVVAAARSQQGTPYQWGGTTPGQGLDCSGLTQYAYGQNGIQIPRTSQQQWTDPKGQNFQDMGQAVPGDLVFFVGGDGTQSAPGHVGIYIGNGMMIDAPHTGTAVRIDNVQSFGGLVGFKHYNQINNTSPLAATNMPPGTAAAGSAVAGSGASNEQVAMQFLTARGYSPAGAAGMVGNLMQESQVNPEEPGGGIAQWQGSRFQANMQTGNPQVDLTNQLTFLVSELESQYPDLAKQLKTATDPTAASQAFEAGYERAGIPDQAKRDAYAQQVLSQAQAAGIGAGQSTGDPGAQVATAEGMDANGGRSIISTPNTFTQAFDESQQALTDTLDAQIRASDPALANAHDYTNAYTMLAKSLRDGITVNNT